MNFESVLTRSVSAQPSDPSLGDQYLVPAAATGADWAGKDGRLALYSQRGWRFAIMPVGKLLYIRDEDVFVRRNNLGTWLSGIGQFAFGDHNVPITSIIGAGASFIIKVENQTTNTPPASPSAGVAYVIGPSPSGTWAGNAGKLAMCMVDGAFTIIAPVVGDQVFDKSLSITISFNGTAWIASAGTWVGHSSVFTASGSTVGATGTGAYTYSATSQPVTTQVRFVDAISLPYAAKRSGATLRVHYTADCGFLAAGSGPGTNGSVVIALFRDSETNAIDWRRVPMVEAFITAADQSLSTFLDTWFQVTAPSTASYSYSIAIMSRFTDANNATNCSSLTRRTFEIEEAA